MNVVLSMALLESLLFPLSVAIAAEQSFFASLTKWEFGSYSVHVHFHVDRMCRWSSVGMW